MAFVTTWSETAPTDASDADLLGFDEREVARAFKERFRIGHRLDETLPSINLGFESSDTLLPWWHTSGTVVLVHDPAKAYAGHCYAELTDAAWLTPTKCEFPVDAGEWRLTCEAGDTVVLTARVYNQNAANAVGRITFLDINYATLSGVDVASASTGAWELVANSQVAPTGAAYVAVAVVNTATNVARVDSLTIAITKVDVGYGKHRVGSGRAFVQVTDPGHDADNPGAIWKDTDTLELLYDTGTTWENLLSSGWTLGMPVGVICIWTGTLLSIPTGWKLCDGTNGTPDLRSMFVCGASAGAEPGGTAGVASHSHTVSAPHTHTTDHAHGTTGNNNSQTPLGLSPGATALAYNPHTHAAPAYTGVSGSSDMAGSTNTVTNNPPFYRVAFIMKADD
jgi:hypothetical protein